MQMLESVISFMQNQVNICPYSSIEIRRRDGTAREMEVVLMWLVTQTRALICCDGSGSTGAALCSAF